MPDEKKDKLREAIGVYERATGKKYDSGVAGGESRKAYADWARSPAGKKAWKEHASSKSQKPKAAPSPSPSPSPAPTPGARKPTKPKATGKTADDAAGALGSRSMKSHKGTSWTGEQEAAHRKNVAADESVRKAERTERLQGTKAEDIIEEGEGLGGASAAEARRKKKEKEDAQK